MPLTAGARLGPFEIVAPLGAGGMGEVYRARDTRLGREVAVKVLSRHLSATPDVRTRFEREAKTISALNHPHICVLHDIGREGETDYLVMELVEGETLAARLSRGPLPISDVLKLGAQIADALDRAHRAGVVHRDLKPGNVMLTKSGAKLMDFGLARTAGAAGAAGAGAPSGTALTQSPTMAQPLTAEGAIVGTFQYMAPEQLEGGEPDTRSDLWALGCVLYEMATGRRAFEGKSQASLIAAVMHVDPQPVSRVAPMTPAALDRLVAACLAKDADDRVQSAHDVKLQLGWIAEGAAAGAGATAASPAAPPAAPTPAARRTPWLAFALVAVAAAAAAALVVSRLPRGGSGSGPVPTQRYLLATADLQPTTAPVLSPDGSYVVLCVREGNSTRLFRRSLSAFEMTPIAGTQDAQGPFFSPDGAWIGFVAADAIKKVPANGGVAQVIASGISAGGCDWGEDGTIWFTPRSGGSDGLTALARVAETGGKVEVAARLDTAAGEGDSWLPEVLPGGRTVLISTVAAQWLIVALRPDGTRHTVVERGFLGRYAQSGHLVYYDFDSEAVLAAPFDPAKAAITGPAVPLTERVSATHGFDLSRDGKIVYVPAPGEGAGDELVWLDRKGAATPLAGVRAPWAQPRLSPDGRRLLLRRSAINCEIWMLDVARGTESRIVHGGDNHDAVWSPDGRRIAYERISNPAATIALAVEGAREVTTIAEGAGSGAPQSWSAGGNLLAYTVNGRGTRNDIWVRAMDGAASATPFLATAFDEDDPAISPDGRWIAYASNEAGGREIFVRGYPGGGAAWQVSSGGGASPLWSRDGRELYFVSGTRMMAAPVETRPALRVGPPVPLFDGGFSTSRVRDFDVAPDGRFVAVARRRGERGVAGSDVRILMGWEQEVQHASRARR